MTSIKDATTDHIPLIREIADKTWWKIYSTILSVEQIRYMLNTIYSPATLHKVIETGSQHFILLYCGDQAQGFAAYGARPEDPLIYKLHKLYVLPDTQGKGYGRLLVEDVKRRLTTLGIDTLDLNVNRYNPAKTFYERLGFRIIHEEDIPIGPYWMNDYVMRITF